MKKILVRIISSIVIIFNIASPVFAKELGVKEKMYNDYIIALLSPDIINVVNEYYGKSRNLDLDGARILNVKKAEENSIDFLVTLKIRSFDKNNKSSCAVDTLTFTNTKDGNQLVQFLHENGVVSEVI